LIQNKRRAVNYIENARSAKSKAWFAPCMKPNSGHRFDAGGGDRSRISLSFAFSSPVSPRAPGQCSSSRKELRARAAAGAAFVAQAAKLGDLHSNLAAFKPAELTIAKMQTGQFPFIPSAR
jgi:hypothetical protein